MQGVGHQSATYYRWQKSYGAMPMDQVKRLKHLEKENSRLKQVVADLTLDKAILNEALAGKLLSPTRRRHAVEQRATAPGGLRASGVSHVGSTEGHAAVGAGPAGPGQTPGAEAACS